MDSASYVVCSLAGQYDNPIPTRFQPPQTRTIGTGETSNKDSLFASYLHAQRLFPCDTLKSVAGKLIQNVMDSGSLSPYL